MATQPARAQPKRKRPEVSYFESSSEQSEGDGSDASKAGPSSKKKHKTITKAISTRPFPKKKIFPFMLLPAELKNRIYDVALTDPEGIFFISRTKQYRRIVEREVPNSTDLSGDSRRSRHRYNRFRNPSSQASSPSAPVKKLTPLVPNILLLNREIYAETQPILYASNTFNVEDTTALHAFLANIGTNNRATLTDVTISGWGYTKAHKAMNHPAFTLLAGATNLQHLRVDCRVSWSGAKHAARQLYRDGFHWLEAMGVAKGTFDAAVDIVDMEAENFARFHYQNITGNPTEEELREEFQSELRKLLRQH